jgi:hypothetical protein
MAYTITNLGPNSNVIEIPAGAFNDLDLRTAVDSLMVAGGWTQEDLTGSGSSGGRIGLYSKNHIGSVDNSYKVGAYLRFYNYSSTRRLELRAYECNSASPTSQTNITAVTKGIATLTDSGTGSQLFCFIGEGYLMFYYQHTDGSFSSWNCLSEYEESNGQTLGSGPTSRVCITNNVSMTTLSTAMLEVCSYVNYLGTRVTDIPDYMSLRSAVGNWGSYGKSTSGYQLSDSTCPIAQNNNGVTSSPYTDSIHIWFDYNDFPVYLGRMSGLKILNKNAGNAMERLSVKLDVDGFTDPKGIATDHFLISDTVQPTICYAIPR